jgi:hypothetical protein
MGFQITRKRLSGGTTHEHIVEVAWRNDVTYLDGRSTTAEMVAKIEAAQTVYTSVGGRRAEVGVRKNNSTGRKYLQTYADGVDNNNLLALPDF